MGKNQKSVSISQKLYTEIEQLLKTHAEPFKWDFDIETVPEVVRLLIRQGWKPLVEKLEQTKTKTV